VRIRTHTNPFSVTIRFKKIEPTTVFPEFNGKMDFEIGFGQCTFIKEYAEQNPQNLIVGVEVRKKAVDLMQEKIQESGFKNVLLVHGNGSLCLQDMFNDCTLDNIFIFHPDPWLKHRHLKRRLINHELIAIAQAKLKIGGKIHISTDVINLWNEIIEFFDSFPNFKKQPDEEFWTTYQTRWDEISLEKNRPTHYATFCLMRK
jgi:tRNA (guanine-N7-)-methyltransferase